MTLRPVVLCILDGWGDGPSFPGNAIEAADTPTMDRLRAAYPLTQLKCSGRDVGLPDGQMGNSEVGHLNLGAGYVVNQWITRIDLAIEDGSFFTNPVLLATMGQAKTRGSALHLMGLVSDGGVHSHQRHLTALLRMAHDQQIERVFVHVFTDGRDTPPESGIRFVRALLDDMSEIGAGKVASVSGRYYAMDRDKRWDRTKKAYDAIVCGQGRRSDDPVEAIRASYQQGVTDEFIVPTVIEQSGQPVATVGDEDCLIFFNFRADRARQLSQALSEPGFSGFERCRFPSNLDFATMTEYESDFNLPVAFPPHNVDLPIARVISQAGLKQFHTAETEKYAHVTYF
ncbi:MAG TPA: 2,3-bisphosphoglycerate-independent phosphoglycerate mutase, partial [Thermomicrobiaceae bacterium]|nr:2,3-bisphosphoglycerate-independent phosphoglycerate mutase [Thermomicrobiaceae bacterium]